ncbi:MAG: GxxExxY protein [Bacteroidota bacterium]
MTENDISYVLRGLLLAVHQEYGPGLYESIYEKVLLARIRQAGLKAENQVPIYLDEEGLRETVAFRIDILVEDKVIIEIKAVEELHRVHFVQVKSYLRLTGLKLGLLINFNTDRILQKPGFNRIANNL